MVHLDRPSPTSAPFINLDLAAISLSGADPALMEPMVRCALRACVNSGEFYTATDEVGEVIGYSLWMPPDQDLFSTYVINQF